MSVCTTCPYCGVGCGINTDGERLSGDNAHPANAGRLCVKGSSVLETLGDQDRLLEPEIQGRTVSWEKALGEVADRFRRVIDQHGPDAVAFYVSGQLLTEDYYVANKLMKGYIGSANIDTNSRLCMSSAVVAHKRAFGEDVVPGCYDDLELADLVILTGSNTAWAHPIVYQRIAAAKAERPAMKVVVIDPRRTATCDLADLHLAINPGQDVTLFNALLGWLADNNGLDDDYIRDHTEGLEQALAQAGQGHRHAGKLAAQLGLSRQDLDSFFHWFRDTPRTVTVFSQGINQSRNGSDQGNAIINAHLATGRVGKPGASPFSITGQPNAMGGREVGGLANQLAVHLDIENPDHRQAVQTFWQSPTLADHAGLNAVDLFRAVESGQVKAVWIMATNPVDSLPEADRVRHALMACDTVVVSDCVASGDTLACADIKLPALGWGEKSGMVTNSERCMSRQRAFVPAPGLARPDWWIITQVARRMGFARGFEYQHEQEIFAEYAALTAEAVRFGKRLDLTAAAGLSADQYERWLPARWPLQGADRCFADGRFSTASGRARFVPCAPPPSVETRAEFPLLLNSGRIRDQWHTMTRTGRAGRLFAHLSEPFAALHPNDIQRFRLCDGGFVRLTSRVGDALVRVRADAGQQPGTAFMPMHWTDQFSRRARVDALVPARLDPHSGQPAFKHTPVNVSDWQPRWHGWLFTAVTPPAVEYWARVPVDAFVQAGQVQRYRLAGDADLTQQQLQEWLPDAAQWLHLDDPGQGHFRRAAMDSHGRLLAWLAIGPDLPNCDVEWLADCFAMDASPPPLALLAGQPADAGPDLGAVVCSCFQVREKTIEAAIEEGADSAEAIGRCCQAGTNCGSCVPELKALLARGETAMLASTAE
ncbi:nitrate reductase large subunit [Alcanivorax hongdengensis A-11-3]|uniref:Nitrate reductase large subunit n=1 Tax=Alcanivorax hongdengensis A-11-3 TaxID=1177179 RepID=L0WEM8_9GAMM|nr:nitrate reductase [Alcanivorax hongdengensis]EKF75184.1 nitrate reductase large subunit [Alcanivorax hongdengensis A-11-3]